MKLNEIEQIQRLGIFFFYDKEGIVDDYVIHMLHHMNKHMTETIIVCNGKLTIEGRKRFEAIKNMKVIVRDNKGFDVWAYKTALEYYGWKEISKFDEIIMYNFTIMGPVCNLDEMFKDMNSRDLDFWGITIHNGASFDPWGVMEEGYIPIHIQSHFIAVRKRMLQSFEFQEYWNNRPMIKCYEEAVGLHEAIFTKKFEECGYKWNVYVDTEDLIEKTFYPLFNMPVELIKNRKCPFFKRKIFISDIMGNIQENANNVAGELYDYLKNQTNYDTKMIIKHLLRTSNQYDFISATNLQYVLPSNVKVPYKESDNNLRTALFLNLLDIDKLEDFKDYLSSIYSNIDIYIAIKSERYKKVLNNIKGLRYNAIIVDDEKDQNNSNILLKLFIDYAKNYDLVCFANYIIQEDITPLTNSRSFGHISYESILKNDIYVENLINLFIDNQSLGMLVPPTPIHSRYFELIGMEWEDKYDKLELILNDLDIDVMHSKEKPSVIPLGNCYWARTDAIMPILNKVILDKYSENRDRTFKNITGAIECTLSLIAQSRGYYSTWVYPETLSQNYLTNMYQYIAKINQSLKNDNRTFCTVMSYLSDKEYIGKECLTCEMHFDTGNGFNVDEMEQVLLVRDYLDSQSVEVEFTIPKGTKFVRFDPCENLMCVCNSIEVDYEDMEIFCYNGIRLGKNDLFLTKDPQYVIAGDFERIEKLKIRMKSFSVFFAEEDLPKEVNELLKEKEQENTSQNIEYQKKVQLFLNKIKSRIINVFR